MLNDQNFHRARKPRNWIDNFIITLVMTHLTRMCLLAQQPTEKHKGEERSSQALDRSLDGRNFEWSRDLWQKRRKTINHSTGKL